MPPDLPQTEHVKVVDDARGDQYQQPTEYEAAVEQDLSKCVLNIPHGPAKRSPLPKQKEKREAARKNVGTAFHGCRQDLREDALKCWAGHDAVLQREK